MTVPAPVKLPRFDGDGWLNYTPIRLPETITVQERLPPGAAAVLINQEHTDTDLYLPVDATELRLVEGDRRQAFHRRDHPATCCERSLTVAARLRKQAHTLFRAALVVRSGRVRQHQAPCCSQHR